MGLQSSIENLIHWDLPSAQYCDSINIVVEIMQEHRVSSLLVKSKDNVVGVISDTDILCVILEGNGGGGLYACDVMTPCEIIGESGTDNPCAQIDAEQSVLNALKVLEIAGTHGLVVSNATDSQVGVVCLRDLLANALN